MILTVSDTHDSILSFDKSSCNAQKAVIKISRAGSTCKTFRAKYFRMWALSSLFHPHCKRDKRRKPFFFVMRCRWNEEESQSSAKLLDFLHLLLYLEFPFIPASFFIPSRLLHSYFNWSFIFISSCRCAECDFMSEDNFSNSLDPISSHPAVCSAGFQARILLKIDFINKILLLQFTIFKVVRSADGAASSGEMRARRNF